MREAGLVERLKKREEAEAEDESLILSLALSLSLSLTLRAPLPFIVHFISLSFRSIKHLSGKPRHFVLFYF